MSCLLPGDSVAPCRGARCAPLAICSGPIMPGASVAMRLKIDVAEDHVRVALAWSNAASWPPGGTCTGIQGQPQSGRRDWGELEGLATRVLFIDNVEVELQGDEA